MVYHLEYPRTLPARRPEGHVPAAPRYSVRWPTPVTTIISDYFGIQAPDLAWPDQHAFFERARASFAGPDGPDSFEIMRCTDEAGLTNAIVVAYWLDAVKHARWEAASQFVTWFRHDDRLVGPIGAWRETNAVPYDRHETIFSEPSYRSPSGSPTARSWRPSPRTAISEPPATVFRSRPSTPSKAPMATRRQPRGRARVSASACRSPRPSTW
jgi:hypothetical protein